MSVMLNQLEPGPMFDPSAIYEVGLIISDVDNTLISDNSPKPPTRELLQGVQEATLRGIGFGVTSARGIGKLKDSIVDPIMEAAGPDGRALTRFHAMSNGGQIYDAFEDKMIHQATIPTEATIELVRQLQAWELVHWVQDGGVDFFPLDGNVTSNISDNLGAYARQRNLWLPANVSNRIIIPAYLPRDPLVLVAEGVSETQFEDLKQLTAQFSEDGLTLLDYATVEMPDGSIRHKVFILPEQSNKRVAITIIGDLSRVALGNMMTMGDGNNDVPMLETSRDNGGVSVAVDNAGDKARVAATHIAPHQKYNGAAIAVQHAIKEFHHS